MCDPTFIMIATAASGAMSAYGQIQQGQATNQAAKMQAELDRRRAADAERLGNEAMNKVRRQGMDVKAAQRAGAAGHGLDVSSGTMGDIQDQTDFFAEADAQDARYNAKLEAWGLRSGAKLTEWQGKQAQKQGYLGAAGTLLGTAGSVAGKWKQFGGGKPAGGP